MAKSKAAHQATARRDYERRIGSLLGGVRRREDAAVKEVIDVLRDFRRDLVGSIAIEDFSNLPSVEATIDARIA